MTNKQPTATDVLVYAMLHMRSEHTPALLEFKETIEAEYDPQEIHAYITEAMLYLAETFNMTYVSPKAWIDIQVYIPPE